MSKRHAYADGNPPPGGLKIEAVQRYVSQFEAPRAANRRLLAAIVFIALAACMEGIGIMSMLPLKQRVPYFVAVNPNSGAVTTSDRIAERFTPSVANERYFLAKWVINLLQIDGQTAKVRLPQSYSMLRGTALGEWKHFIFNQWKPLQTLKSNPSARVYPTINAVGLLGAHSAAIRVTTHNAQGVYGKHLLVTVQFAIIPPTTDAQVFHNPIGLWITHFEVTDETLQQ